MSIGLHSTLKNMNEVGHEGEVRTSVNGHMKKKDTIWIVLLRVVGKIREGSKKIETLWDDTREEPRLVSQ